MTEFQVAQFEQDTQPEQQENNMLSEHEQLEQAYIDLDGFWDFSEVTLPSLPEDLRARLITVMLANKENSNLLLELDEFEWSGFPTDEFTARYIIEKFSIQGSRADELAQIEENDTQIVAEDTATDANTAKQAELLEQASKWQADASHLADALSGANIDFKQELKNQTGIDLENTPITTQEQLNQLWSFLDANAERFLKAAQETSPGTIVAVYEGLQAFSDLSPKLPKLLASYESQYLLAQEALNNPKRNLRDIKTVETALWDSDITSIDGDFVRGENGELVDLSQRPPALSLEGEDGLVLPVWPVETADTRKLEVQSSHIELQIAANEQRITQGEQKLAQYDELISGLESHSAQEFGNDELRAKFCQNLIAEYPEFKGLLQWAEETDSAAEFLVFLKDFVTRERLHVEQSTEVLRAKNAKLRFEAGKLAAHMKTQRRIASEKIQDRKERVRASQTLMERSGTSRMVAALMEVFPMISEQNPVHLPSGDIITGFDPAMMTFQGSFTPGLWSSGADDFRTQEVYFELCNTILTGGQGSVIEIASNGAPAFRLGGELVDRMDFDAFVNKQVWSMTFRSLAMQRLFESEWDPENKS